MPYLIQYDQQNKIIIGTFSGEVNRDLLRTYSVDSQKLGQQYNCQLILSDYLDASFSFSVVDLYRLPVRHNELMSSLGSNIHVLKRASVFNKKFTELAKFFEDVAVNRGQKFKAFTDRAKALEWLLAE